MAMPAAVIDANKLPLMPVRNGLFVAANGPMPLPVHAHTSGLTWMQEVCGGGHLYPAPCITPPYQAYTYDPVPAQITAYPFAVYASEVCGVIPNDLTEIKRRLLNRLRITEQAAVEKALWGGGDGVTGVFEQLQAAGGFITTLAASTDLVAAVSVLEQQAATAQYYGPLLIHARPRMAAYAASRGTLIRQWRNTDGLHLYTQYGSEWVFGAGYSGNMPDGTPPAATTEAMYITGRIHLWSNPEVFVSDPNQVLNRTTNQRGVFALREYALAVECFAAATLTTRA